MTEPLGQRQLAAIVFTDVAGFSSRMRADEERTLRRVREDLSLLADLSKKCQGNVVKNTGDGLLISFGSAIDAVSFALEAQRRISFRNERLSPADRLEHRMGIHLGDVFLSESDAMGDGVNIAARLQAEAEPGGICISQTVYDVVKNKLAIKAVSLGPRELKNIRDAIYAYRIVVDAESGIAHQAPGERTPRATGRKVALYSILALAALLVIVRIAVGRRPVGKAPVAAPEGVRASAPKHQVPPPAGRDAAPQLPPAGEAGMKPSLPEEAGGGRVKPPPPEGEGDARVKPPLPEDGRMVRIAWIRQRLAGRGPDRPLIIRPPRRAGAPGGMAPGRETVVWMEGDELLMKTGDEIVRQTLEDLPPRALALIAASLAREDRVGGRMGPPPPGRPQPPPLGSRMEPQ
jgi:class 3 adenylate cyclase